MKIGSLFDGSGGFPLAATMCGIEPVWASEVEPYPIAVTRSRFPNMKHLGSVTDIKGNEVEPVDIITFGSPCQDLSVAGKRAGLKHTENGDDETTRSGLFMEAVRIIKEMREATNGRYPEFAVWENVPGAFSSNKGLDFRIVLEELIRIADPTAVMPDVPKAGWPYADVYYGEGWSLGYRVVDAQHFGVPQRRRRIYLCLNLVSDPGGKRIQKILFEREGLRGYFAESGEQREAVAGDVEDCAGTADRAKCFGISSYESNSMKSSNPNSGIYVADTSRTLDLNGGNPACNQGGIAVVEPIGFDTYNMMPTGDKTVTLRAGSEYNYAPVFVPYTLKIRSGVAVDSAGKAAGKGALVQTNLSATLGVSQDQYLFHPILDDQGGSQISVRYDGKSPTLRAEMHGNVPCVMEVSSRESVATEITTAITLEPGIASREGGHIYEGVCGTLRANAGDNQMAVAYSVENHPADSRVNIDDSGKVQTLTSRMGTGGGNVPMVMEPKPVVCIEGNGARPSHLGDGYSEADAMYTLNTIERHAVAYEDVAGVDCRNAVELPEQTNALQAVAGHSLNGNNVVRIRYIVRRLTPTECARLQGFPDKWGHPDIKETLSDEEYVFWLNVRNTHAAINDKVIKEYTKEQMLAWYNKLHTDSSEYKLWGNGIALPCALYVMQGIAEVSNG